MTSARWANLVLATLLVVALLQSVVQTGGDTTGGTSSSGGGTSESDGSSASAGGGDPGDGGGPATTADPGGGTATTASPGGGPATTADPGGGAATTAVVGGDEGDVPEELDGLPPPAAACLDGDGTLRSETPAECEPYVGVIPVDPPPAIISGGSGYTEVDVEVGGDTTNVFVERDGDQRGWPTLAALLLLVALAATAGFVVGRGRRSTDRERP